MGDTGEELVQRLAMVLTRWVERGLYAAAHKAVFHLEEIGWCGRRLYTGAQVKHDPERVQRLTDMRRPKTARELQQFLCALNWMRTALPGLAEKEAPLRDLLESSLRHTSKTRQVAAKRVISTVDDGKEASVGVGEGVCEASCPAVPRHTRTNGARVPGCE